MSGGGGAGLADEPGVDFLLTAAQPPVFFNDTSGTAQIGSDVWLLDSPEIGDSVEAVCVDGAIFANPF